MGCNIWYTGNKNGYSNLFSHITSKHVDYKVIMAENLPPETSSLKRATDLYQWLYQIIINRLPINATKWSKIDEFTRFHVFNSRTITKYIYLLADYVAKKIKEDLKSVDMVNFVIDGWTSGSHHIIGPFGCYEIDGIKKFPLLSLSPLEIESNQTAENHKSFIYATLEYYDIDKHLFKFFTADN
jgi:hypothetical protein